MMFQVKNIQGTARIVNYAGLVRGGTQRLIKLEITGIQKDDIIDNLNHYLDGITYGSDELNLIEITDEAYQNKSQRLQEKWKELKIEIYKVRRDGYKNTDIVNLSEEYFTLADQLVSQAEVYSQNCATAIRRIETWIDITILFLVIMMIRESVAAIKVLKANRELNRKVYKDERTGLPNRNQCEELLNDSALITESTCCMMFDLNNLKYVNDNLGHDYGDEMIQRFAEHIRAGIPEKHFVGRYGGDEFIAIVKGCSESQILEMLERISQDIETKNNAVDAAPISYAAGYARSEDFDECTLRILLSKADQNMYVNNRLTKGKAQEVKEKMDKALTQMIQALGMTYTDCFLCNMQTDKYYILKKGNEEILPVNGSTSAVLDFLQKHCVNADEKKEMEEKFNREYIRTHLSEQQQTFTLNCHWKNLDKEYWWQALLMYIDSDEDGNLFHYMLAFHDCSSEREWKFQAQHDGLTGLYNKSTALELMRTMADDEHNCPLTMYVMDFDNFKQVNDKHGHHAGDMALKDLAMILRKHFQNDDIVARFGGDEFFVLTKNLVRTSDAEQRAENLLIDVRTHFYEQYPEDHISLSFGVAYTNHSVLYDKLFYRADEALYDAKKAGRDRYSLICVEDEI